MNLLFGILALGYLTNSVIGGVDFQLIGPKSLHRLPGETITVKAKYKLCKPLYCPNCIRVMYVNAGGVSTCIKKVLINELDCMWREISARVQLSKTAGVYDIRFSYLLEYHCRSVADNKIGVKVGSVQVGNVNECDKNPCKNGGVCTNTHGDYYCKCPSGWGGKNCDKGVDESWC